MAKNHAVVGTQWGDEGKGKVIDHLAAKHEVIVRYQGGTNAGHTVVADGQKFALHLIPSGILHTKSHCLIADGVVVDLETLLQELTSLKEKRDKIAKLFVSKKAHLIMPWHKIRDAIDGGKLGTTGKGIGPTYTDATNRVGIRMIDLLDKKVFAAKVKDGIKWNEFLIEALASYHGLSSQAKKKLAVDSALSATNIVAEYYSFYEKLLAYGIELVDSSEYLSQAVEAKKKILFEGAQATLLDITHGDYPFVTSSHPTYGGIPVGTGIRPRDLSIVGVVKAYSTRVGNGPFATELENKTGIGLRERGHEYGTTTGRPRRCGWLDLVVVKYAKRINGLDALAVTKLDILSGEKKLKVAIAYHVGNKKINEYPVSTTEKEQAKPVYVEFPGWKEDITKVRKFADLPKVAQKYIQFIEDSVGVPVKYIGVGPGREELIVR
ncbi:MAG: adenylosuccinate synthase [Microgenomates group bacterium]